MKHLLPLLILLLTGCVTQETEDNTPLGNFDALWSSLDSHYCFFAEKKERHGLDWNEARQRYRQMVTPGITNRQLFEVLANLTCELRDGHVNLLLSIFFFIERKVNNYFLILQPIEVLNYLKNRYIISLGYIHYI